MSQPPVSILRLNLLRAMYLFMAFGLGMTIWPEIISFSWGVADTDSVVYAMLGALGLLCLLGVLYPLKMLPLLIFELAWKLIWVLGFALRMHLDAGLDEYATETLAACLLGIILVPLVVPWGYFFSHYIKAPAEPWRRSA
ncbi:hypothetical protein L2725_03150 [Shewanella corallii]|uniref:DoxX family protein n=1 Tax=Shewanella corallii TaxID=560080 RepID=A0ABT0N2W5_9GAMM|nr:hypothetical protein [Shewanella corallii]MCL2912789.1 hypothetical protein [Shewanella corallii]